MKRAKRGDWVEVHRVLLEPGKRAPGVPEDTARVPLEMRMRGFLLEDEAVCGQQVRVRTLAGRVVQGTLVDADPRYTHDFGRPVPELLAVGPELKRLLRGAGGR